MLQILKEFLEDNVHDILLDEKKSKLQGNLYTITLF